MELIFLKPIFKDYIWGGTRLKEDFNKNTPYKITGESWEISTNKNGKSIIKNGKFKNLDLEELFQNESTRKNIFGTKTLKMKKFPLLIKFIDAKENLSVQVHPNDSYAKKYENDTGKTEMWYILDCIENSKLICGFKENIEKENLKEIILNGKIKEYLNYTEIKKGDVIYVPSGTVHAILGGTLICEIQQNSDLTYRVYDWDRISKDGKKRELHIDKAIDVIDTNSKPKKISTNSKEIENILNTEYFKVDKINIKDSFTLTSSLETFYAMNVIDGTGNIYTKSNKYEINKGDSFIIPATIGECKIVGKLSVLKSYI